MSPPDPKTDELQTYGEFLSAVEAAGMYPWQWDIRSGRVTWSRGIGELFGIPQGASVATFDAYMDTLVPEARALVSDALARALGDEAAEYYVEHPVGAGEAQRWVAARGRVSRDGQGTPVRLAGVVWDITQRKQDEASLARLDRQWSMVREINRHILHARCESDLFTNACRIAVDVGGFRLAWVGLVSSDGVRVEVTARCGRDIHCLDGVHIEVASNEHGQGPAATAVRGERPFVMNDLGKGDAAEPWRAAAVARGHRSVGAFPLRRDGRVVGALSVSSDVAGMFDEEHVGLLRGLADDLGYVLDLLDGDAKRRVAEAALRSSEERYRAVFQQAFEGIFIVAPSHAIIDANESACRMLGYTREQALSLRAEDVVHRDDLARVPIRFGTIPPGGVILSERRFVCKDGSILQGELSTKALLDGNFQVVVRDVTERKQVQAQLLLADRMSSLGRLASGVAHELNNPLAYVMLNLELLGARLRKLELSDPNAGGELARGVSDAYEGAERMRRIVRTLSTFGRGDEDSVGPVDVNGVLDSAVEIASMQLRHRARLTRRYEATGPARADPFRLGQVFLNLLVNAADALREGAADNEIILVTRLREDGMVVVEVHDNGTGIPVDLQPRIFDPFFTTKPVGKGTGLGLAVCHAIVTSFGGQIVCESTPGQGAVFRMTLPRAIPESAISARSRVAPDGRGRSEGVRGRVLVADDDARVARILATTLDAHEVTVVSSGRDAIDRCRTEPFDCILCDVMMPDVSGVDVHDALRLDGRGMERRIIFVTGGAVTDATRSALARLDNPVLEKPVDMSRLRSVVGAAVAEGVALVPG
jgi:PAS domain S-box-containing protein